MRSLLACSLVLLVRHASADDAVDLRDDDAHHTCTTPCVLRVPPGAYPARVDGLDRTVIASDAEVVITPTRHPRLILALSLITLGAAGLTFAGHWSSPLDNDGRLAAGLAGAAVMGFAIPVATSSSARVGGLPSNSRADVFAGVHQSADRDPMVAIGVGYRPRAAGFGAQLRGRFTQNAAIYQFAIGPTFHGPRVAWLRPAIAMHVGFSSQRGPETPADLASETPAMPGEIGLHALFDLEARLELELPISVQPSIGVTAQTVPDRVFALDIGLHVKF